MSATPINAVHSLPAEADPRFFQAVQYVLGELSVAEHDAFEAALADDVALCLLVAEAAQLLCGVKAALTESRPAIAVPSVASAPVAPPRTGWTLAALAAAATGLAATLLVTFTVPSSSTLAARSSQAVQLVSLWRDAGRGESGWSSGESSLDAESALPAADDRVPLGMLAAVSLEDRRPRTPLQPQPEQWEDN